MLRYSFNEADYELIELDKEVDYLKKYLNLQNLRTSNSELVEFNISIENPNTKIAPMLLIPFVENAFKHTTDKDKKQGIKITLDEKSGIINFKVSNIYDPEKMISKDTSKGIGISNVSKRMEILYPGKHKLNISHDSQLFKAELTIDTSEK
jgi:LytS/YehU family sensor histidine kinase